MTSYCECPKCGNEISMYVDYGDHYVENPEDCDECGYEFSKEEQEKIYSKALQDAFEAMIDYATDRNR